MIKILLCGCNGKMGKVISRVAESLPNLSIVAGIDRNTDGAMYPVFDSPDKCDVAIDVILDFSRPEALDGLLKLASDKNKPVIFCTTGYTPEQLIKINEAAKNIPIFRSANMSIGINIVNSVLKNISAFLYNSFDIEIIEKHHNQKVDSPSGTALLLAHTIQDNIPEETVLTCGRDGIAKRQHKEIGVHAIRGGSIVGDHEVIFAGAGEIIEVKHTALSRDVFAIGALKACEFMPGKNAGLYSMDDVIKK